MIKEAYSVIVWTCVLGMTLGLGCGDDDHEGHNSNRVDAAPPSDGDVDANPDGGPCAHLGALDSPCTSACDCDAELACRGWPGEQVCASPCADYDQCQGVDIGCAANPICDLNTGACRCSCEGGSCPGGDNCVGGYCVGCADDGHCDALSCSGLGEDHGVCNQQTGECVCGGACGDGVCDAAEQAGDSCPADCPSGCVEGEVLTHACPDTTLVAWCSCIAGSWDCVDPQASCPGTVACMQGGGLCVDTPANCHEGEIATDPQGCTGGQPECCVPLACTAPGQTYAPYAPGLCCPGLKAIDSMGVMESWDQNTPGMQCCSTCFVKICAPCGDGVCQLHLGESTCNCPEDCPVPPFPLVCSTENPDACGSNYCRQEGADCYQSVPLCVSNVCEYDVQTLVNAQCDPAQGLCITP